MRQCFDNWYHCRLRHSPKKIANTGSTIVTHIKRLFPNDAKERTNINKYNYNYSNFTSLRMSICHYSWVCELLSWTLSCINRWQWFLRFFSQPFLTRMFCTASINIYVTTAIALVQSASVLCYRRCLEYNAIAYNIWFIDHLTACIWRLHYH